MTSIEELYKAANDLENATIYQLLALRLLFDESDPIQNIAQDLSDLYTFPERIEHSYPQEWLVFVKRGLKILLVDNANEPRKILVADLQNRLNRRPEWFQDTVQLGNYAIANANAMLGADNVLPFPSQHRALIDSLIK